MEASMDTALKTFQQLVLSERSKESLFIQRDNMDTLPIDVIISGPSGSGKSTLGGILQDKYPHKIVMMEGDTFFTSKDAHEIGIVNTSIVKQEHVTAWRNRFSKNVNTEIQRLRTKYPHHLIVFSGLPSQWAPLPDEYLRVDARVQFYLDIDLDTHNRQYYQRVAFCYLNSSTYVAGLADNSQYIMSSTDLIFHREVSKEIHLNLGYILITFDKIMEFFQECLGQTNLPWDLPWDMRNRPIPTQLQGPYSNGVDVDGKRMLQEMEVVRRSQEDEFEQIRNVIAGEHLLFF